MDIRKTFVTLLLQKLNRLVLQGARSHGGRIRKKIIHLHKFESETGRTRGCGMFNQAAPRSARPMADQHLLLHKA